MIVFCCEMAWIATGSSYRKSKKVLHKKLVEFAIALERPQSFRNETYLCAWFPRCCTKQEIISCFGHKSQALSLQCHKVVKLSKLRSLVFRNRSYVFLGLPEISNTSKSQEKKA